MAEKKLRMQKYIKIPICDSSFRLFCHLSGKEFMSLCVDVEIAAEKIIDKLKQSKLN